MFGNEVTLEDLNQLAIANDADASRIAFRFGLLCTLFVANSHSDPVRQRLAECGDEYLKFAGENLQLFMSPAGTGKRKPYRPGVISLRAAIEGLKPSDEFDPDFTGAPHPRDASVFSLDISAISTELYDVNTKPGFICATFPLSFVLERPGEGAFQAWVRRWCESLRPVSGYAGLCLVQSVDATEKLRTSAQAFPIGMRFPGLELDNPRVIAGRLGDRVKGTNWLTVLADSHVEQLGGRNRLLAELGSEFRAWDYPGGVLIQAGQMPQIGDVNRRAIPSQYRQIAALVKPIRVVFPEGHSFLRPAHLSGAEATNRWLSRFDV